MIHFLEPSDKWDQGMLRDLLLGDLWDIPLPTDDVAVMVVPGGEYADQVDDVNAAMAAHRAVLLVIASDEASSFPVDKLSHPNMRLWVMTPRPDVHDPGLMRFIGEGWSKDARSMMPATAPDKTLDWLFAGQVTHSRRRSMVKALKHVAGGELLQTNGFSQGYPRDDFLRRMLAAKVAPAPSGPRTQDSFRLYEALEAGCIPVADDMTPDGRTGYWRLLFGDDAPFPVITEWNDFERLLPELLMSWPANANRVSAWWQQYKRGLAYDLQGDFVALGALLESAPITVLMPTSPIPSHPSTDIIEQTIESVRTQLPSAEILIMCDGVRHEQEDRRADYEEYLHRLTWLTNHRWRNVLPIIHDQHVHQANTTRHALGVVRTPLVLFVEHDTPLCGEIPWPAVAEAVMGDEVDVLRFHHEANVLEPHQHLMLDRDPQLIGDVPMLRTVQWSQRPHLAKTARYREWIAKYFPESSRTMIEDKMHSAAQVEPWPRFKLWMYAPEGNIKRSTHLDGRSNDPKFEMQFS